MIVLTSISLFFTELESSLGRLMTSNQVTSSAPAIVSLFCFVGLDFNFNYIKKFFQMIMKDVTTIVFIKSLSFERIGGC